MDKLSELTTGAKVMLGSTVAFLIVSFLSWFDYDGPGSDAIETFGGDTGVSMWHGVGVIAGLAALALLVWEGLRLAGTKLELGISSGLVSAGLAALVLLFAFIRFIDAPSLFGRTIWAWLGLLFALGIAAGAWMVLQAAGERMPWEGRGDGPSATTTAAGTTAAAAPPTTDPATPATPAPTPAQDPPAAAPSAYDQPATTVDEPGDLPADVPHTHDDDDPSAGTRPV